MTGQSSWSVRPRLVRLRADFEHLYPGITPEVWVQAAVVVDKGPAVRLRSGEGGVPLRNPVLERSHFEFRHGTGVRGGRATSRGRATDQTEKHE